MAEKYAGFLSHIERSLGEAREVEPPTVTGRNRGYGLFFCYSHCGKMISVVTNGLRFQNLRAVFPQELVCTALVEHRKAAHLLTMLISELILSRGVALSLDQNVLLPPSLSLMAVAPSVLIEGAIASNHPYIGASGFNTLCDEFGKTELQIITLIPATRPELELAARDVDAMYTIWEERETNLLDFNRASSV